MSGSKEYRRRTRWLVLEDEQKPFPSHRRIKLYRIVHSLWGWTLGQSHRRVAQIKLGKHPLVNTDEILGTHKANSKRRTK